MPNEALSNNLAEVISRIELDAYKRGWDDAHRCNLSAVEYAHKMPVHGSNVLPERTRHKAQYGALGKVIDSALRAFADQGITPIDVIEHGREVFEEDLLESSVRGRLNRMHKRGELRKGADGRWVRTSQANGVARQGSGNADVCEAGCRRLR